MYHVLDSIAGLTALNILTEMYVDCTMGHGLDKECGTCVFDSDFGTGSTTQNLVWTYMVQRAAVFFQAVMGGKSKADLGNNLFVECVNTRERCNQSNTRLVTH